MAPPLRARKPLLRFRLYSQVSRGVKVVPRNAAALPLAAEPKHSGRLLSWAYAELGPKPTADAARSAPTSTVERAQIIWSPYRACHVTAPMTVAPGSADGVIRSSAKQCAKTRMFGWLRRRSSSVVWSALPVASPEACRMRRWWCPPSRPSAIAPEASVSKGMPSVVSSRIAPGPPATTACTCC